MSNFEWNKRAVAAIAVISVLGILSPVSAQAFDGQPDDIVTVSVDLGDGDSGGGGGGNTCTGYGSLDIPSTSISVTKERKYLPSFVWASDVVDNDNDTNTPSADDDGTEGPDPRDFNAEPVDEWDENTRTSYVSNEFSLSFDADNCVESTKGANIWVDRQPVERYMNDDGYYWTPVELAGNSGILSPTQLKATSNILVDYSLFGVNRNNFPIFNDIPWGSESQTPWDLNSWGTSENYGPPVIWGSSGTANMNAVINIFGEQPKGKFRVKYGFWMETQDNYSYGPWMCFFNGC